MASEVQLTDLAKTNFRTTSVPRQPVSADQIDDALRALPSNGWSSCWTGRRDRALLVLSQMARLSFQAIAELTVADVSIADGVAIIRTPGGATTLRSTPDGRICGPCALARWLHALDLTAIYPNPNVVTAVIARAAPLTANSPHLCQGRPEVGESIQSLPVLPSIDQWGPVPQRSERVPSTQSISRRRPAGLVDPEWQVPVAPPVADTVTFGQSTESGATKRRMTDSPVFPRHLSAVRAQSNYSLADRENIVRPIGLHADGLEGRAWELLEHCVQ